MKLSHPKDLARGALASRAFAETADQALQLWSALGRDLIGRAPSLVGDHVGDAGAALEAMVEAIKLSDGFDADPDAKGQPAEPVPAPAPQTGGTSPVGEPPLQAPPG